MLHAWEKYGLEKAEQEHIVKYRNQSRSPYKEESPKFKLSFKNVLLGKIGFIGSIRGKDDFIYIKFLNKLISLSPDLIKQKVKIAESLDITDAPDLLVTTEGPSDWMHIKAAFNNLTASGKYTDLAIKFDEYDHEMGNKNLLQKCKTLSTIPLTGKTKYVFIFDSDDPSINRKANNGIHPKRWADKVFSFSIPTPSHRKKTPIISIEFYYKDEEIKRVDTNGRRLFINHEFDMESQIHKTLDLFCTDKNKFEKDNIRIIDNDVFDRKTKKNVALPKKMFAKYVRDHEPNFADFDFQSFCAIFDYLVKIQSQQSNWNAKSQ
jgi:RNA-directed DNA polymerase